MRPLNIAFLLVGIVFLNGCMMKPKVHIYSEMEKQYQFGGPNTYREGATGEVQYCVAGGSILESTEVRRQNALKEIERSCNGDYYIRGEMDNTSYGQATSHFDIGPRCNFGRSIVFNCGSKKKK